MIFEVRATGLSKKIETKFTTLKKTNLSGY